MALQFRNTPLQSRKQFQFTRLPFTVNTVLDCLLCAGSYDCQTIHLTEPKSKGCRTGSLVATIIGQVKGARVEKIGKRYRVTTECDQRFAADQEIVAAGLETPARLEQGAGLAWQNGISMDPLTLRTKDIHITP